MHVSSNFSDLLVVLSAKNQTIKLGLILSNHSLIVLYTLSELPPGTAKLYNSKFNFEPNIGEVYHLYNNRKEEPFLSIIAPEQCSFHHLGSFRLNTDKMWEKLAAASTTPVK